MADEVRLVDLEVIKRYSLAVRQESAPAADLLAALDASREAVLAVLPPEVAQAEAVSSEDVATPPRRSRTRRREA